MGTMLPVALLPVHLSEYLRSPAAHRSRGRLSDGATLPCTSLADLRPGESIGEGEVGDVHHQHRVGIALLHVADEHEARADVGTEAVLGVDGATDLSADGAVGPNDVKGVDGAIGIGEHLRALGSDRGFKLGIDVCGEACGRLDRGRQSEGEGDYRLEHEDLLVTAAGLER